MKAILTGMNGTVAPATAKVLADRGCTVTAWDRSVIDPADHPRIREFVAAEKPDWIIHMAMGDPRWAEHLAVCCRDRGIGFLFTSTVSVFHADSRGPYAVNRMPDATDDYGRYKIECERLIAQAHPGALIARLGWQIGEKRGSNNMVDFLEKKMESEGRIEASAAWYPSCAFLPDTAEALWKLTQMDARGIYQLEGNPGLSFYDIVTRLNRLHGGRWNVIRTEEPRRDNRMADDRIRVSPITDIDQNKFH